MKQDLTEYEETVLLPRLIKGFRAHVGRENAVTATRIISSLKNAELIISGSVVRKLVKHIRQNRMLVGLASSPESGYWIENDPELLRECIDKLMTRAQEQLDTVDALKRDWIEMTMKQTALIPAMS